jgi:hypothetical protein
VSAKAITQFSRRRQPQRRPCWRIQLTSLSLAGLLPVVLGLACLLPCLIPLYLLRKSPRPPPADPPAASPRA